MKLVTSRPVLGSSQELSENCFSFQAGSHLESHRLSLFFFQLSVITNFGHLNFTDFSITFNCKLKCPNWEKQIITTCLTKLFMQYKHIIWTCYYGNLENSLERPHLSSSLKTSHSIETRFKHDYEFFKELYDIQAQ
jgi:hypothetical protein